MKISAVIMYALVVLCAVMCIVMIIPDITSAVTETTTLEMIHNNTEDDTTVTETTTGIETTTDVETTTEVETTVIVEDEVEIVDAYELEILAHLLNGEAGSDWCSDTMIYYVGSVVLNRVACDEFPDTLEGVIFQDGQYACTWDGNYDRTPSERHYQIAEDLLLNGSVLPEGVVFQAEFLQGSGLYEQVQNMYFCYM